MVFAMSSVRKVEINLVIKVVLLHLEEQTDHAVPHVVGIGGIDRGAIQVAADHVSLRVVCRRPAIPAGGECVERVVVFLGGQAELLQVVLALGTIRRFSRRLNRRHDESDENGDDRDHDEQLDQGECCSRSETTTLVSHQSSLGRLAIGQTLGWATSLTYKSTRSNP